MASTGRRLSGGLTIASGLELTDMAEAVAKEFSAETQDLAKKIVGLTLKQAQELVDCLKDQHGIEPAGGGAVMMAAPAGGGAAAAPAEEKTAFDVILKAGGD